MGTTIGNIQMIQAWLQLQALNNINSSSIVGETSTDDSFSSLLDSLLQETTATAESPETATPLLSAYSSALTQSSAQSLPTMIAAPSTSIGNEKEYDPYIERAAALYNVDPKLIRSVIQNESGFNPASQSQAGALGLMQLMPTTAASLGVTNRLDPEQNILGGTKYLKQLLDQFNGNKTLAVAAYNAGPGNVEKYKGIPPFSETQNYVKKVLTGYYSEV
ncbi:soluble lytic murein transglycosylase-like protein [Pullulanibacillus pueri]|uniref:Transglycosylase SLT domain-containing protein n=1 Tax=Pullulanibacillus pueri TaxID=1437324 RepID=A0A8J3ENB7_9BACL|nr:lytic transglycosylase domain-containing protein [Pullulanibacillus pueri]MBM7680598.1 soluble lytic murein transglycosylase-like protein [Pullulanibacillus pueri]GGH83980.1 hypothetical protein GCM10007096_26000 [Pullulanibacillus pueri]